MAFFYCLGYTTLIADAKRRTTALQKKYEVLREWQAGRLKHGSTGEVVPDDRQDIALAIANSIARKIDPSLPKE